MLGLEDELILFAEGLSCVTLNAELDHMIARYDDIILTLTIANSKKITIRSTDCEMYYMHYLNFSTFYPRSSSSSAS